VARGGEEVKTLKELKTNNLARLDWKILFKFEDELSDEDTRVLDDYFKHFVNPEGFECIRCGKNLTGTFRWGLTHGVGACSNCGYPARAYHRDVGPIKFLNIILQYHPEELEERVKP
jgi:hypothetical protein